jgi:hypothetical protein
MKLEPHGIVPEGVAGQPRPANGVLALADPLLNRSAAVIEFDHPLSGARQVDHYRVCDILTHLGCEIHGCMVCPAAW